MSPSATMTALALLDTLCDAESPSLSLAHPTHSEKTSILKQSSQAWRNGLSVGAYLRREEHLYNQALTRTGGITHWILVDRSEPAHSRTILASCETIRKRGLIAYNVPSGGVRVKEVLSHGIGSVFCAPELRGRGYAGRMMKELGKILQTWQVDPGDKGRETCLFTALYSDIGKVCPSQRLAHICDR